MKHLVAFVFFSLMALFAFSQADFSGVYGRREPLSKEMRDFFKELKPGADDFGYDLKLILKKVSGNKYKFWLYVCKGFPSYNSGQVDGFIEFNNTKARFRLFDDIVGSCKLDFSFNGKSVFIDHDYGNGYCGFGANVTAQGIYPLKRKQVKMEDIEETFQYDAEESRIATAKAYIYKNQTDTNPSTQYFIKGDRIPLLKDELDRVYTEFISMSGKFVYGWVKKTDLKN